MALVVVILDVVRVHLVVGVVVRSVVLLVLAIIPLAVLCVDIVLVREEREEWKTHYGLCEKCSDTNRNITNDAQNSSDNTLLWSRGPFGKRPVRIIAHRSCNFRAKPPWY